ECSDRLGDIEWFRSPWQKSGAATGFTSWRLPDGNVVGAIAKAPVGPGEYFWSSRLGEVDPMWWESDECRHLPVPRVLASGKTLAGYDIAWLVEERVSGKPISKDMSAENIDRLFAATAKFHKLASEITPAERGRRRSPMDWSRVLARGVDACRDNNIPEAEAWIGVIEWVLAMLPGLLKIWRGRPMDSWCHGDLHPGNVLTRCNSSCPEDRCGVLIDLALVHPGHWVEDALYLERLYWGREESLYGIDPLDALARHRRAAGLHADKYDDQLADVRRVLMGATSPAFLSQENDQVYLSAALDKLRYTIPRIGIG
ncbi:MAG: aminoglycoside phosphotransferase family protein, partial [Phycisphaerales bacterium]|nr:aminoglycoside phosphotransferase family protein [Phycisphaerales bacterium]